MTSALMKFIELDKKRTQGEWVLGEWYIKDEDRAAQKAGGLYWSIGEVRIWQEIAVGPYGRKSREPESVIDGSGYDCGGITISAEDSAFICQSSIIGADLTQLVRDYRRLKEAGWGVINVVARNCQHMTPELRELEKSLVASLNHTELFKAVGEVC